VSAKGRWELVERQNAVERASDLQKRLRILPRPVAIPADLREKLAAWDVCGGGARACVLLWEPSGFEATAISGDCDLPPTKGRSNTPVTICSVRHLAKVGREWEVQSGDASGTISETERAAVAAGLARGKVDIRPVQRRQVSIGGVPVDNAFE
jgi:hypothetical protein